MKRFFKTGINTEIALTYMVSRRKQTIVAALGVTFGISMFIFMNSLMTGTNEYFEKATLNTTPHLRIYKNNRLADHQMLDRHEGSGRINLISNPQLIDEDSRLLNAAAIVDALKKDRLVTAISPQVSSNVIYSNGGVQKNGNVAGINILEQDKMFDIAETMVAGHITDLSANPDGIIIGYGLSRQLNLSKGDYITLTAPNGSVRRLTITGIFRTTIKSVDESRTYANTAVVQQLLRKDRSYFTDIFVNLKDYETANEVKQHFANLAGYDVETWRDANEQLLAARVIRTAIANAMVITILIVAGFGIYNILNMVIYEKIKEIAILKATGFQGRHVIGIFLRQALFIGILGSVIGMMLGWLLSYIVSRIYVGMGNVLYLPMAFRLSHYLQGAGFGVVTAFFAGYIPAVKASKVDPVQIIRG